MKVADYYNPLEYDWSVVQYEADQAIKECIEGNGNMKIIGLIGGIASGKSTVAKFFLQKGAGVIDVDKLGHEVLDYPEVKQQLVSRFGQGITTIGGSINRRVLAQQVFKKIVEAEETVHDWENEGGAVVEDIKDDNLSFLEAVTWPLITEKLSISIARYSSYTKILVIDAAMLLEGNLNKFCEKIIFVDTPLGKRKDFATNLSRQTIISYHELDIRESCQMSIDHKRKNADYVIINDSNLLNLEKKVYELWAKLT